MKPFSQTSNIFIFGVTWLLRSRVALQVWCHPSRDTRRPCLFRKVWIKTEIGVFVDTWFIFFSKERWLIFATWYSVLNVCWKIIRPSGWLLRRTNQSCRWPYKDRHTGLSMSWVARQLPPLLQSPRLYGLWPSQYHSGIQYSPWLAEVLRLGKWMYEVSTCMILFMLQIRSNVHCHQQTLGHTMSDGGPQKCYIVCTVNGIYTARPSHWSVCAFAGTRC